MKISDRTDHYHNHTEKSCVYQWSRIINGKEFFFTSVSISNKHRSRYIVTDEFGFERHSLVGGK